MSKVAKPDFCLNCPINNFTEGYVPPRLTSTRELIVGDMASEDDITYGQPFVGGAGRWVTSLLKASRQPRDQFNIIHTIGCKSCDNTYPGSQEWKHTDKKTALEGLAYCKQHHLQPLLDSKDWNRVLAFGEEALQALTPRASIMNWRGSPLPLRGKLDRPRVIPTLHPSVLMKGSNLFPIVQADIRKSCNLPPENYKLFATPAEVEAFDYKRFVFDFEWDSYGNITIAGICGRPYEVLVFSWVEPYVSIMKRKFEEATDLYGHNIINADSVYFDQWRWDVKAKMWDTMLMQHLVQPDYRHGLAFCASVFSNRPHWKGDGKDNNDIEDGQAVPKAQWKTWNNDHAIPIKLGGYGGCQSDDEAYRLYNARDNAANYDIIEPIEQLLKRYNLESLYWDVSRPTAYLCRDMAAAGLKISHDKLNEIANTLDADIIRLESELPDSLQPTSIEVGTRVPAPPDTYKPAKRICKGTKKLGTSHEPTEIWFSIPETTEKCPVCDASINAPKLVLVKTIPGTRQEKVIPWNSTDQLIAYAKSQELKLVYNHKTKQLSADKTARKAWGKHENTFVTVDKLKKASTLRTNFAKDSLKVIDRMYYNLKVHGTGEGRLSCSGMREGIDFQIQNAPKIARKLFVPDTPDDAFLSFDIGQGENILTTWLAEDWERWERINTPGYDEHSDLANKIFNCDCSKDGPNDALRQVGKKVNHLKNYGGKANKIHEILVADGYNIFTLSDCREFDNVWRKLNLRTAKWQDETIELARVQGFLRNNFGRMRWFNTADFATKALAFNPASTLADCVLRMMIACHQDRFANEITNLKLSRSCTLPPGWSLRLQVHDDLTFHGPMSTINEAARLVKHVMTMPWAELNGLQFNVDGKYSQTSWGDLKTITIE